MKQIKLYFPFDGMQALTGLYKNLQIANVMKRYVTPLLNGAAEVITNSNLNEDLRL